MILEKTIDLLTDIRDDAQQQEEAKPGIESYCNHIHFVLQRYGNDAEIDKVIISNAYWLDLALVCLMFRLVKYRWEKQVTNIDFVFWKDRFEDNLYKWYEPSSQLLSRIREWVSSYSTDEQALQTFVLTAEKASSLKEMRGSLGEFYTPLPVANHLAKNLVKSDWSGNPIKIVDQAVGIGSLLGAVTSILIKEALANKVNASQIMCQLNRGLYGFDVQPAAVLLARLRLTLEILSVLSQLDGGIPQPLFPNLSLLDPLVEPETYWETTGQFCSVIANPPFARLNRNKVSFLEKYEDVLYGHANFYHLFVWWAVQATKPGGKIVFLLPQSFRSGLYGHRLHKHLADKCDLEGITMFTNRTGV
ncbi:MAG: N-6 DNA methylase, partial [Deltaproteobacteria bacterium]|nr:N-6 DNA methylase [Deltaproteobacteria bacterium]